MNRITMWLILVTVLTSGYILDSKNNVAYIKSAPQETVAWSDSVGNCNKEEFDGTIFSGPIYNTIHNIRDFLAKRNLDVQSTDGRFELFYKLN